MLFIYFMNLKTHVNDVPYVTVTVSRARFLIGFSLISRAVIGSTNVVNSIP